MTTTDFSKFRDTGELSDLTVTVEDHDFKLHKFPLFIKSDFFRALARSNVVEKDKVQLEDFPGGATTFELVANYCYNIRIEVNEKNVCKLRCAAEFLQMNKPGNLDSASDRLLIDILTTAKLDRNISIITDLLLQCKELGAISEQAKIVDKCILAIIECWLFSTKFIKAHTTLDSWSSDLVADRKLFNIPFAWFVLLFTTARDKSVRPSILADLVQSYITYVINKKSEYENEEDDGEDGKEQEEEENKDEEFIDCDEGKNEEVTEEKKQNDEGTPVDQDKEKTDDKARTEEKPENAKENDNNVDEEKGKEDDNDDDDAAEPVKAEEPTKEVEMEPQEKPAAKPKVQSALAALEQLLSDEQVVKDLEIAVIIDTLIGELPDNIVFADYLSPRWTLKVLKVAEGNECKSTDHLRKLVSRVVHRLSPDELCQLSADLLGDIVTSSCKDDQDGEQPHRQEMACNLVDTYLSELAVRDQLTVDTFNKMVDVVPAEFRFSHDTLYQVMEALIKSEKVKLTEEQKESVLESIDFSRLTESTLRRAYETELVPEHHITKAALALCSKLRADLEDAHSVISAQEKQIDKYNFRRYRYVSGSTPSTTLTNGPAANLPRSFSTKYSRDLESLTSPRLRQQHPTTYSSMYNTVPTYPAESELKLALDSLERVSDDYHSERTPVSSSDSYSYKSSLGYGSYLDDHDSLPDSDFIYSRSRYPYRTLHDPWPYRY